MRSLASVFVVAVIAACSSDDENVGSTQTGGTGGNGSGAAGSGGTSGASGAGGLGGIVLGDGSPPLLDGPDLADAGWFDCGGCACDGATHYCFELTGGAKAPSAPPPPDAALCGDAGLSGCKPLPANCTSCSCIPMQVGGACECSDDGGGLLVFCALP